MNAVEISTAIAAAYAEYCSTNFHNMTPRMIADMMRGGICKALRAIDAIEANVRADYPRGGKFLDCQMMNIDALRQRAEAVWQHMNAEIERNIRRAA